MTPEDSLELIQKSANLTQTHLGYKVSDLGVTEHVTVDDSDRTLHTMVTGPTGTGKTNVLMTIFLQDVQKTGGAFLNPKGEVIGEILAKLPEGRLDDVIYINPGENRCPAINPLAPDLPADMPEASREMQRKIIVSNVMALFRRLSDDLGERWPRNLRSLLTAHVSLNLHHSEQNTLLDVYQCVEDTTKLVNLRKRITDSITEKQLEEIENLSQRERQPLLRRLSDLLENKIIRRIITQPESSVSFRDALANQKIILVDAQGGHIGDWAARIIGSIVLTQLWSATAARNNLPRNQRPQFHVHIDEIQAYLSEADHLRRMLSQCREFGVSLTVCTQFLDDLDPSLTRAILNNTMTKVVLSPGASEDLPKYTRIMNRLSKQDLGGLGKYQPAIQRPAEGSLPDAEIVSTYPPWNYEQETVEQRISKLLGQYTELQDSSIDNSDSTGDAGNSGGEHHRELLEDAITFLEFEEDVEVKIIQQDGSDRPDAHIIGDEEVAHLEAEHTTLSHSGKVLKNLERAREQCRECVFIVEEAKQDRLNKILEDIDEEYYRVLISTDLGVVEP